jgi:hypothetical protein
MHQQRQVTIHGHEREIASAHRHRLAPRPVVVPLSDPERQFLLYRLCDRTATTDAVLHNPDPGLIRSSWTRDQVLHRLSEIINALRRGHNAIMVSPIDKALVVQAIEGNPYFAQMHLSDPRLTVDALRQANALRERIAAALERRIARVPLGAGLRSRLPDKEDRV